MALPILLVVIAVGGFIYYRVNYAGYFPHNVRRQVHIALYYPVNPPDGLRVDRTSFQVPYQGVVTYTLRDTRGNKFYVSEQALPGNFDFTAFKAKFESTDEITVPAGNALVGDLGIELIASIQTPKNSWIIINTPDITGQTELEALSRTFVQAD